MRSFKPGFAYVSPKSGNTTASTISRQFRTLGLVSALHDARAAAPQKP
jgi:hypothetical protein